MTKLVAYQGCPGAFGHEACLTFLPDREPVSQLGFAQVIEAVLDKRTGLGMLPLRNSIAGMVREVESLLPARPVTIISRHWLPIRLHLLGRRGARIEQIHSIVSHEMALAQCGISLARLDRTILTAPNTAAAAKALAEGRDEGIAVLASEAAAALYGLSILQRDMQDKPDNRTEFVIVAAGERQDELQ
ncbi:prephenate dehydratase domain-containing protein [Sphingosinicella rhizophila]|uniref:prephenate dehydratase n=1 Tax=Sphingosinicella rhizophila TaxID=3050082 RepID=A0ABU3Q9Z4_9SPHN|nr:prephenate dehydratase domain-containing protein [Sphingosinicella sp. GR2756]MDT9599944.1 prephenate dehydratase domain-containing protein [Sphingosinicella sp. GR2756]